MKKALYLVLGCLGLALGAVGAVLPMLPAFPFLVLAAFSFARSSERLHTWFVSTKLYKENLESFVHGRGMTVKTKLRAIVAITLTMGFGFVMMKGVPIGRLVLGVVWLFHLVYFLFGVKTLAQQEGLSHPYCTRLLIEGMQGKACARRLEDVLNRQEHTLATVSYRGRTAVIYTKEPPDVRELCELIVTTGYGATQIYD